MTSNFNRIAQHDSQPPLRRNDGRIWSATWYAVRSPLQYRALGSRLNSVWKLGRALDMSAAGILIDIPDAVPVGTRLELAMDWTGLYHGKEMMRLYLYATVARAGERGTVLRILSHRFRDASPAAFRPRRSQGNLALA